MLKLIAMGTTSLIGVVLSGLLPALGPDGPPPAAKKKGAGGAAGDLQKAYNTLRRLRADDGRGGRSEDRLRGWADRAAGFYRKGLRALDDGDDRLAHEYGAMAHDLARAADHAASAARLDRRDSDLPPPPGDSPAEERERTARDLRRAFDRIRELEGQDLPAEARFYLDAARDLYRAARRDAEAGRPDRAGELARAAEAMTHVPEHMLHSRSGGPDEPPPPVRKDREKAKRPGPRGERKDDLQPIR